MWQWLVVAPLVAVSAAYAAWRLMPVATRMRFANRLAQVTAGGPLQRWGGALKRAAQPAGSCESCPATRIAPKDKR